VEYPTNNSCETFVLFLYKSFVKEVVKSVGAAFVTRVTLGKFIFIVYIPLTKKRFISSERFHPPKT